MYYKYNDNYYQNTLNKQLLSINILILFHHYRINIYVRRLGGGYGAKISRNIHISTACALACYVLNRPTRFIMSLESNMMCIGKRYSAKQEYNVGVDSNGIIQYLNAKNWHNGGGTWNEGASEGTIMHYYSCYNNDTWNCIGYQTKTDIPPNTWARAPGKLLLLILNKLKIKFTHETL